jgi:hypothetical protein
VACGAFGLFRDTQDVAFVVAFQTWLNVMVINVLGTRTVLWTETIGGRFDPVPGYRDLGGSSEGDASFAADGVDVLVTFGRREDGECSSACGEA